ncbi:hypothetical protein G9A89_005381 [Geosiphon pyriformis]|nr:hypothetical protein G9A89_005381 [Geosiphon pyriformis]
METKNFLDDLHKAFYSIKDPGEIDEHLIMIIEKFVTNHKDQISPSDLFSQLLTATHPTSPKYACIIGVCYYYGCLNVPIDPEKSFLYYKMSAEFGDDPFAQNQLGYSYRDGMGISKDFALSFYWIKKSAEGGNICGQRTLGDYYLNLKFVDKIDMRKAVYWYVKAAQNGNPRAYRNLGISFLIDTPRMGILQDVHQAFRCFRKANYLPLSLINLYAKLRNGEI